MKLIFPEKKHEKEHRKILQEFIDNNDEIIPKPMIIKDEEEYDDFLKNINDYREWKNLKPERVKCTLYFLIDNEEKIVGAIHIRHELNDDLKRNGGNIGYGIRPNERRKWYATIWLRLALEKCKELWMDKVLINCRKDNIWSSKTIIKNWWIRDSEYEFEGKIKERYRISIK